MTDFKEVFCRKSLSCQKFPLVENRWNFFLEAVKDSPFLLWIFVWVFFF